MSPQDVALLKRWNDTRDADAFCEIVERYSGLVYGACLRVLRNPADAEDVAQECFLKVSEASAAPTTSLPGWLHTMATRRALNRLRAEKRRVTRETAFAGAADEAREHTFDEVQEFIDEAIAKLPDDLRVPLVEHYLLGRTYESIGDELGVTRQAVSQRVQKGVEQVRVELRGRGIQISSGALPTGLAGLAGIVATEGLRRALRSAAIGGLDAGALAGLSVKSTLWLMPVIFAVSVGLVFWNTNRPPSEPPRGTPAVPVAAASGTAPEPRIVLTPAWNAGQTQALLAMQSAAGLTGTATKDFTLASLERPVPGPGVGAAMVYVDDPNAAGTEVTIYNVNWKPWEKVPQTRLTSTATIGDDRKLVFRNLPLGNYHIKIRQGENRGSSWYMVLSETLPSQPLPLPLLPIRDVPIDVRDEDGNPVYGAEAFTYRSRTLGGELPFLLANGAVRRDGMKQNILPNVMAGSISVFVRAPGFASHTTDWINDHSKPISMVLTKGVTVTCRLIDADGDPVAGAIVHLQGDHYRAFSYAWSNEDGFVEILNVAAGNYELRIHSETMVLTEKPARITVGESGVVEVGDVVLARGPDIVGRVYDKDTGEGIANVTLSISAQDGTSYEDVQTDLGGHYAVMNASLTRLTIQRKSNDAYGYGAGPQMARVTVSATGIEGSADFALSKGIPVSGRVRDSSGRPVAGAVIRAAANVTGMSVVGLSDRRGQFTVQGLTEPATLYMSAAAVDHGTMVQGPFEIPVEGRNDIELRTTREACVVGSLRIDGRFAPANTYIYSVPHDPKSATGKYGVHGHYTYTGPLRGRFMLSYLAPGTYDLTVAPPGSGTRSPVVATVTVREGEIIENFDIDYRTSGLAIAGRITDRRGQPVAFARVNAFSSTGVHMSIQSDAEGVFSVSGLSNGAYTLEVTHEKYSRVSMNEVKAPAQGLQIVMPDRGGVTGFVRSAVTNGVVQRFKIQEFPGLLETPNVLDTNARTISSDTGAFRIDSVELAGATLVILADGHAPGIVHVTDVREGQTAGPIYVTLNAPAKLAGTITDVDGKAIEGAVIRTLYAVYNDSGVQQSLAKSDANGRFETDRLQAGDVQLIAAHPNYVMTHFTATLAYGVTSTADVALEAGGTLTGMVFRQNEPAPGVYLRVLRVTNSDSGSFASHIVATDAEGNYEVPRLPAGEYIVHVMNLSEDGMFQPLGEGLLVAIDNFGTQVLDLGL